MKFPHLALLLAACLFEGAPARGSGPEPAPGHENAPVIFFCSFHAAGLLGGHSCERAHRREC